MTPEQLARYQMEQNMLKQQAHAAEIAKRVGMQQQAAAHHARAMASGVPGVPPAASGAELLRLLQGGGRPAGNGHLPPPTHAPPKVRSFVW